jgi:hypothetical protein
MQTKHKNCLYALVIKILESKDIAPEIKGAVVKEFFKPTGIITLPENATTSTGGRCKKLFSL